MAWDVPDGFDVDAFLARPLVARVATFRKCGAPAVRPVWFLWDDGAFWWLTGGDWSKLESIVASDPRGAIVVDSCDVGTGEVKKVSARGTIDILPYDPGRARKKLAKYLGPDESAWDPRFGVSSIGGEGGLMARLEPSFLQARDSSFKPSLRPS